MWKAYIDDSGTYGHSPLLVLGGFVASVDQWLKFSDAWQQMLDMPMRIAYFKMNEAATLTGEFRGWSESRRNERVALAYKIIDEHVQLQLSCIIELKHFYRLIRRMSREISSHSPYYVGISSLFTNIARHQRGLGITEKIDFIFDDRVMEKTVIRDGWEIIKALADPDVGELLGRTPQFEDDKEFLPLQAADLMAWWVRAMAAESIAGIPQKLERPWTANREIPGIQIHWNEARLKQAMENANRNLGFEFS